MRYGKIYVIFALVLLTGAYSMAWGTGAFSARPEEEIMAVFSKANALYEKANYDEAAAEYEKVLEAGYESGPLYYNLGGAYFKAGKLGKAILNYERAANLIPRDADLKTNHNFAKIRIKARVLPRKSFWDYRPIRVYYGSLTADEITLIASFLYIMGLLLLTVYLMLPIRRWYHLAALALVFFSAGFNAYLVSRKIVSSGRDAIVTVSKVDGFFGPFDSATKFFTLNEGMKITVLKMKDDWLKIRRLDGKTGWIRKLAVERISAPSPVA